MNKNRRKEIYNVSSALCDIQYNLREMTDGVESNSNIVDSIRDLISDVEMIRDDEMDYMDNMPENLQSSDRYYAAEEAVDNLDEAIDYMSDAVDHCEEFEYEAAADDLDDAMSDLEDAAQ